MPSISHEWLPAVEDIRASRKRCIYIHVCTFRRGVPINKDTQYVAPLVIHIEQAAIGHAAAQLVEVRPGK